MKTHHYIVKLLIVGLLFTSCKDEDAGEEDVTFGVVNCQKQPAFLSTTGFDLRRSALSTSEKKMQGLVLIELPANAGDTNRREWQHPSWKQFGWMGPITTDDNGNTYTAPVPVINLLDNHPEKQNVIYKVNSQTAEMAPFVELPSGNKKTEENVFGLLGLYFDCYSHLLYAASVYSSTRDKEAGLLYAIDPADGKIKDKLENIDAAGLCVSTITGEKRLYYGSTRISAIYSVKLDKNGNFSGSPKEEISLDLLGPRGDDKARRIRFDKNGDMIVFGIEFNYNLTAPTEKQETTYRFNYNDAEKKWEEVPK